MLFARNKLCAISQPDVEVTADSLLDVLTDENIKAGTSIPKADPSGDYAWKLLVKAEKIKDGRFLTFSKKALQLTGDLIVRRPPEGRNTHGWVMDENHEKISL